MSLLKRSSFWVNMGAGIEYYDFVVFAYLSPFLSQVFFKGQENALLKTYMVYAVGYVARPLGALLYGTLGDYKGRRSSLLLSMLLMSLATLGMTFLPFGGVCGFWSAFMLVVLRCVQGASFGAELPGALTLIAEGQNKSTKVGGSTGFVVSSVTIGSIFASGVVYFLSAFYGSTHIVELSWRYPLFLGAGLGFLTFAMRMYLRETDAFLAVKKEQSSKGFWENMREIWAYRQYLIPAALAGMFGVFLIVLNLHLPAFLSGVYHYKKDMIYGCLTWGLVWSALILPFVGSLADRLGHAFLLKRGAGLLFVLAWPLCYLFKFDFVGVLAYVLISQVFIAIFMVTYFPLLIGFFPVHVRFKGVAFCYNAAYICMSFSPALLSLNLHMNAVLIPCFIMGLVGVSYVSFRVFSAPPRRPD